jgi:prepilin peptidase dependent protein B
VQIKALAMKKQAGLSLIELMIALAIGLILLGAIISVYIVTINGSTNALRVSRLNHDMSSIINLMANDIKRAGYSCEAFAGFDLKTNSFTGIEITNDGSGITYAYDAGTGVGDCGVLNDAEFFGFRLNNDAIEVRNGVEDGEEIWLPFTDSEEVSVTSLSFSLDPIDEGDDLSLNARTRCLNSTQKTSTDNDPDICGDSANIGDILADKRVVNIRMTGSSKNDPAINQTFVVSVEVRNHRIYEAP